MKTFRLTRDDKDIKFAGGLLRVGELVAFPTETVYGLGADALNEEAVKSVYEAKGRPSDNPMIVHISRAEELPFLIKGGEDAISDDAIKLIEALWPGPLTMVFPKSDIVPYATTGGLDTVAIRMPNNQIALRLIDAARTPIAAPSANLSGKPSPTTYEDVLEDMDGRISAVIMGDQCSVGIESTVLDMTGDEPVILRPGIVTPEWISTILGRPVTYDAHLLDKPGEELDPKDGAAETNFKPKSPGMKYKHYAPKAMVKIVEGNDEEFKQRALALGKISHEHGYRVAVLNYEDNAKRAAHGLFADLRELDRQGYDLILIKSLEEVGLGFSVMNRMLKSAGYDVIKE